MDITVEVKSLSEIREDAQEYVKVHFRNPELIWPEAERVYIDGAKSRDNEIYKLEDTITRYKEILEGYKTVCTWCDKCPQIIDLQASNSRNEDRVMKAKLVISTLINLLDTKELNSQNSKEIKDAVNFLKE
jgi:hypothetical protein